MRFSPLYTVLTIAENCLPAIFVWALLPIVFLWIVSLVFAIIGVRGAKQEVTKLNN